jgi:hypothetical protein
MPESDPSATCPACGQAFPLAESTHARDVAVCPFCAETMVLDTGHQRWAKATAEDVAVLSPAELQSLRAARARLVRPERFHR